MTHEEIEQNLALYAVGALDRAECPVLEAHLAEGCVTCQTALKEYRETAGLLPHGLPVAAPPAVLKDRIETAALAQVLAQTEAADADATLRTPDGDITIRVPPPAAAQPGDVTIKLPQQAAGAPDTDAAVRMPSQPAARPAPASKTTPVQPPWWAWAATPAFASASVALALGIGAYTFVLNSRVTLETAQRRQAETTLQQQVIQTTALRQELTQARQELIESKQRLSELAALPDTIAQREMDIERLRAQLDQKEKELVALYKTVAEGRDAGHAAIGQRACAPAGRDGRRQVGGRADPLRRRAGQGLPLRLQHAGAAAWQGLPALSHYDEANQRRDV